MKSVFFILFFIAQYSAAITFDYTNSGVFILFDQGTNLLIKPKQLYARHIISIEHQSTRVNRMAKVYQFSAITDNGTVNFQITHGTWQLSLIANDYDKFWSSRM